MGNWVVPGYTEVRALAAEVDDLEPDAADLVHPEGTRRVALAWHDPTGTPVVIRYLLDTWRSDEELLRSLRADCIQLSQMDSPHVVRYHEFIEAAEGLAIVMELVDGASMSAIHSAGGPIPPVAALVLLRDMLLGLVDMHARGVAYRDVSSEFVLVDTEGRAKLMIPGVGSPRDRSGTPADDVQAALDVFDSSLDDADREATPMAGSAPTSVTRAASLIAELDRAASRAYGDDWESRGREVLGARAAQLLRVPDPAPPDGGAPQSQRTRYRWRGRVLVGVAITLVVAVAVVSLVTR